MNKDWNYAHMWDTMRRALEESELQGLEVGPLDVLKGMHTLEELEERHRQEREEQERRRIREMQTMWDGKIELYGGQEREERKEREKLESFPIWQLETIREDGKECYRIYRAIDPSLPNWEGNRLYMPGTWDDAGIASNIAAEKTAMEAASKTRKMQTMFDVKIEPFGAKAEGAKECE